MVFDYTDQRNRTRCSDRVRGMPATTPREKTLRRLVDAVESLLAEGEDYTALSVERILSRADIARSTFYAHFDGKGALLRAVGESVVDRLIEASRGWSGLAEDAGREELHAVLAHLIAVYREQGAIMGAMAEASAYDEDVRLEFGRLQVVGQRELSTHVENGQAVGAVRADADPDLTIRWLVWMVERCLYTLVRTAKAKDVSRHVDAVTGIVWATLYEGAPTRPSA
jgi:AcrR family transcriptional regulator